MNANLKQYRARCWRKAGKDGTKRLLLATLLLEAEAPDDAARMASDRIGMADYVEVEQLDPKPAA